MFIKSAMCSYSVSTFRRVLLTVRVICAMGKFKLRIKPLRVTPTVRIDKRRNNAHAKIARKVINATDQQMNEAVAWCFENGKLRSSTHVP